MTDFKITPFPRKPAPAPATAPLTPAAASPTKKVVAITDGACEPNPGDGGWGVVLRIGDEAKELYGGAPESTNQRMEITAVIMALKALDTPSEVEIISDSQYVIKTMTDGWKRKANKDLWAALDEAVKPHKIIWTWVRGHNGHVDNERADALSLMGIEEARGKTSRAGERQ